MHNQSMHKGGGGGGGFVMSERPVYKFTKFITLPDLNQQYNYFFGQTL